MSLFSTATREGTKARIGLCGIAGSGKTLTALRLAEALAEGGPIFVIDTEHRSASKYAPKPIPDPEDWSFIFESYCPSSFSPEVYTKGIEEAIGAGAAVIVLDSLTHAWEGSDGELEQVNSAAIRKYKGNTHYAWRDVTPLHLALVEAMLSAPCHIIGTIRSKVNYESSNEGGKFKCERVGTKPKQKEGMEYEFDVFGELDADHNLIVTKSPCSKVANKVFNKPGPDFAQIILDWLSGNVASPPTDNAKKRKAKAYKAIVKHGDSLGWSKDDVQTQVEGLTKASGTSLQEVGHLKMEEWAAGVTDWMLPPKLPPTTEGTKDDGSQSENASSEPSNDNGDVGA